MRNLMIKFTRAFTLILLSLLCLTSFAACEKPSRVREGVYVITEYEENEYLTARTTLTITRNKPENFPETLMHTNAYMSNGESITLYYLFENLAEGVEGLMVSYDPPGGYVYSVRKNGEWHEEAFYIDANNEGFKVVGTNIQFTRQK